MKRIIVLLVTGLIAVYGIGRFNLGESGAMRFIAKMESLMGEGYGAEVCDMFHDDLEVEVIDHSGDETREVIGGKSDFCALARETAAGLRMLPHSMSVNYTDVTATQSLTSPWTSAVSYDEHRTLTIQGANISLRTVSNDEITLVQTLKGVKLRKVKSEIFKADAI
jgi:hypothetical protein